MIIINRIQIKYKILKISLPVIIIVMKKYKINNNCKINNN